MRRVLACSSVLLAAAASSSSATTSSGLYGFVRRGPIVPVCVAGQPCDGPARSFPLVFRRNGKIVARTTTTRTGAYRVRLAPGAYSVTSTGRTTIGRPPRPSTARVLAGKFRRVDFFVDTGIR
jgi:hypothetical protein